MQRPLGKKRAPRALEHLKEFQGGWGTGRAGLFL